MQVVGLMGSPRRGSNTDILLNAALRGAEEAGASTRVVRICELNVGPCSEYYHCAVDGTCSIHDDMTSLYDLIVSVDRIILSSPVFFYGLSGQAKAMVDRCQALWVRRYVLKSWQPDLETRRGLLIAQGATRGPQLFLGVSLTAKYFFDAAGIRDFDELLFRGLDGMAEVMKHPDYIEQARAAGRKLAAG